MNRSFSGWLSTEEAAPSVHDSRPVPTTSPGTHTTDFDPNTTSVWRGQQSAPRPPANTVLDRLRAAVTAVDPFLSRRTGPGGVSMRSAHGTADFMSPEMSKWALAGDQPENETDGVEEFLMDCGKLFPDVLRRTGDCRKSWLRFRSFLHPAPNESSAPTPNFMLYKLPYMQYRSLKAATDRIGAILSDGSGGEIGEAWKDFYAKWSTLAPELMKRMDSGMRSHPNPNMARHPDDPV